MSKIRLGIIGCGGMIESHAKSFVHLGDVCEITAACDVIKERAKKIADIAGAKFFTADYKEMVDHVDAVLVVLPHHLHFECGMFFLGHNKHVLMEKPLCNTEEECVELANEADKRKLTLMCAYPVRYWPGILKLKELLDSGQYGDIMQMSIWTEQYTNMGEDSWAASAKKLGGGQLFSHGCHYIDLLLWFLGNPVSGAHIGSNTGTPWMEMEGTSNVVMTFENGSMGYHFGTWGARGTTHGYNFQIFTTSGFFEYQHHTGKLFYKVNRGPDQPGPTEIVWSFPDNSKQTQFEIIHFLDCVKNNSKPLTDAHSAIQGLRVIWKLYEAEANNQFADIRGLGLSPSR